MKKRYQTQNTFREIIYLTSATSSGSDFQYKGLCSSHDDNNPSLSIKMDEDKISAIKLKEKHDQEEIELKRIRL